MQVCKSVQIGGLRVKFLGLRNKAMLFKWAWRFGVESGALWRNVFCEKYDIDSSYLVLHRLCGRLTHCSIYVADILRVVLEDSVKGKYFRT